MTITEKNNAELTPFGWLFFSFNNDEVFEVRVVG